MWCSHYIVDLSKLGVSCDRQECVLVCHGLLTSNRLIVSDGSPLAIDRGHGDDVVYYEERKREIKRILIYDCRCNE